MKKYFLATILGGAMIAVIPASASTTTFNFATGQADSESNSAGDTLSLTVGGVTVTETAWYVGSGYSGSSKFQKAALNNYNANPDDPTLGLGVCSANDPDCGSPHHQVDNAVGDEFILFQFSSAFSLSGSSIQVANYAPDGGSSTTADLTYYSAATAITSNSTTLSAEGTGTTVANQGEPSHYQFTDALSGGNVSYLLIAAAVNQTNDAFKVNELIMNSSNQVSGTPEPATFGLIGLALTGLGIASRKRRK
jgi:hypothetical protein